MSMIGGQPPKHDFERQVVQFEWRVRLHGVQQSVTSFLNIYGVCEARR